MKKFNVLVVSLLTLLFLTFTVNAQENQDNSSKKDDGPTLKITGETAGIIQYLQQENDQNTLPKIPWGFQSAEGNLFFNAHIASGINVYFEAYLSSQHHPGYYMSREGYVKISHLPKDVDVLGLNNTIFKYITFKAGAMEIDYGIWHLIRSDNGQVQNNPLIGNSVVDPNTVEPSAEISSKPGLFNWVVGLGTGTTQGDFEAGRGTEVHGKVWLNLDNDALKLAGSVYHVNHSANGTGYPTGGSTSDLLAGNRSGSKYAGIFGDKPEVGQVSPQKGQKVTAYQFDGYYNLKPLQVYGQYGYTKDADMNGNAAGSPEEAWSYYNASLAYYLTPALYVAGRYSGAVSKKFQGQDADIKVNRIQLGAGVWVTNYMLLKLEYVNQKYEGYPTGNQYAGNARFHGLLTEFSVAF